VTQIMFDTSKVTGNAIGRNGVSKCCGLDIYNCLNEELVEFAPINSRGHITNCRIDIPRNNLPEIIAELTRIAKEAAS